MNPGCSGELKPEPARMSDILSTPQHFSVGMEERCTQGSAVAVCRLTFPSQSTPNVEESGREGKAAFVQIKGTI